MKYKKLYKNLYKMKYKIVIVIIIIVIIIFIYNKIHNDINKVTLGNYLSKYFCNLGLATLNKKNFYADNIIINVKGINIRTKTDFINLLPSYIPFDQNLKDEFDKYNITTNDISFIKNFLAETWNINNKKKEIFWLILKKKINPILNNCLEKYNLKQDHNNLILHFRCSDVPFAKLNKYHLNKYKVFNEILLKIKNKNVKFNKIIILSCNNHMSSNKNTKICNLYTEDLKKYLINLGYNIEIQCNSLLQDFALMFYAPITISCGGSFSFMAGFFGNSLFYACGHAEEGEMSLYYRYLMIKSYISEYFKFNSKMPILPITKCTDCGDWLNDNYILKHSDVKDYYDIDTVLKQLRSTN